MPYLCYLAALPDGERDDDHDDDEGRYADGRNNADAQAHLLGVLGLAHSRFGGRKGHGFADTVRESGGCHSLNGSRGTLRRFAASHVPHDRCGLRDVLQSMADGNSTAQNLIVSRCEISAHALSVRVTQRHNDMCWCLSVCRYMQGLTRSI